MTTHNDIVEALKKARATIAGLDEADFNAQIAAQIAELDDLIANLTQPNPDERGFFWWLLAVGFHEEHVQDGIDFTDVRIRHLLEKRFPLCHSNWIAAKVIGRPADDAMARVQGYKSVEEYLKARGGQ